MGYSQTHISRLLAKALNSLRSQVREPELAVTARR
jgi:DNA-directed RNA polymerase specialized sigma subunit